jgi:5,5'-dehydrodivanillate O-demethylase oxygenase subunit
MDPFELERASRGRRRPYTPQHVKVDFSEFEYGFQYKRIRTDTSDKDRLWTVGRVCLWPNGLFTGNMSSSACRSMTRTR